MSNNSSEDPWYAHRTGQYQTDPDRVPTLKELKALYRVPLRDRLKPVLFVFVWATMLAASLLVWALLALVIIAVIGVVKGDFR